MVAACARLGQPALTTKLLQEPRRRKVSMQSRFQHSR